MSFWVPPPRPFGFWHPASLLGTWFGIGLLRPAPGTWGSLAAILMAWIIAPFTGQAIFAALTLVIIVLGFWASDKIEKGGKDKDPSSVVIDEVAGQWIVLIVAPHTILAYALAFALFRFFDIVKPWPISVADKKVTGGLGIMLDDLLAGFIGGIILVLILLFAV